jgi:hypothetical protein
MSPNDEKWDALWCPHRIRPKLGRPKTAGNMPSCHEERASLADRVHYGAAFAEVQADYSQKSEALVTHNHILALP